jgi:hypothetical protein
MACVALRDQLRRDGGPMSPKRWQMSEDRVVKQLQQPSPMQVMVSTLTGHDHKLKGKLLAPRGDTPTPATGATLLHALSTWLRGAQGVAGDSRNQAECAALGFEEAPPSLPASQPPSLPNRFPLTDSQPTPRVCGNAQNSVAIHVFGNDTRQSVLRTEDRRQIGLPLGCPC